VNGYRVLLAKELEEQLRTYRLLVVSAVLLLLGVGSMIMLLFLPQLLSLSGETGIVVPEQTAIDALNSYHGNIMQVGFITVVLRVGVFSADSR